MRHTRAWDILWRTTTTRLRTLAVPIAALLLLAACDGSDSATDEAGIDTTVAPTPAAATAFDDSSWASATEWSAADVSPKDGYDQISWDPSAQLIWGTDLEVDNTVLLRATVS